MARQGGLLLFCSMLRDTGVVIYSTGFSDSLAEELRGGLLKSRVARGTRDDQGVKC